MDCLVSVSSGSVAGTYDVSCVYNVVGDLYPLSTIPDETKRIKYSQSFGVFLLCFVRGVFTVFEPTEATTVIETVERDDMTFVFVAVSGVSSGGLFVQRVAEKNSRMMFVFSDEDGEAELVMFLATLRKHIQYNIVTPDPSSDPFAVFYVAQTVEQVHLLGIKNMFHISLINEDQLSTGSLDDELSSDRFASATTSIAKASRQPSYMMDESNNFGPPSPPTRYRTGSHQYGTDGDAFIGDDDRCPLLLLPPSYEDSLV